MANSGSSVHFSGKFDTSGIKAGVADARAQFNSLSKEAIQAGSLVTMNWRQVAQGIGAVAGINFGIQGLREFASEVLRMTGTMQGLALSFETMLGSKSAADRMMADVKEFALATPYTITETAATVKQLIAMGAEGENVIDTYKYLGDVAAGLNVPLQRIAINFGQVAALGKLQQREIRDFAMAGVPIYAALEDVLGKSRQEITAMVTAGQIGFPAVLEAFKSMASEGGRFNDMMSKMNSTVLGQMNRLQDQIEQMFAKIGEANTGVIYGAISGAASIVAHYEEIGKILVSLIATYGAYRAAVIATTAVEKGWTVAQLAHYNVLLIVEKAQKLLNRTMLANPYVLAATVLVGLVSAMVAFRDRTTEAEKAQKLLNDTHEEFAKKEQERRSRIEELVRIIQDETQTIYAQITAYEELQKLSPAVTAAYSREELAILDLTEANKALNAEQDKRNYNELITNIDTVKNKIAELKKELEKPYLPDVGASYDRMPLLKDLEVQENLLSGFEKNLADYNRRMDKAEFDALPPADKIKIKEEQLAKIKAEFERVNSVINEEVAKFPQEVQIPLKVTVEDDKKGWQLYSPLSKLNTEQARADVLRAEISATEAELKVLEDGNDKKKALSEEERKRFEDEARKKREAAEKASEEYRDLLARLRNDERQADIDAMQDGIDKELKQIEHDYDLRIAEINAQEDRLLKAKEDANRGGLTDDETVMFQNMRTGAGMERDRASKAALDADRQAQQAALDGFRSFEQEYLRLYADFQEKRKRAALNGANDAGLGRADFEFNESVKQLATDFAENTPAFKDWADGIRQIAEGALDDGAETVIEAAVDRIEEMLLSAKAQLAAIEAGGVNAGEGEEYGRVLARIIELEKELASLQGKKTVKKTDSDWKKTYSTLQKVAREFEEIGDAIGGTAGEAIKLAGTIATSTVTMIDGIKTVSAAAVTEMSALEKASVILTIISAGLKVVSAIAGIFKSSREATERAVAANREYAQSLREIEVENRYKKYDTVFGTDNIGKFNEAVKIANESLGNIDTIISSLIPGTKEYFKSLNDGKVSVRELIDSMDGIEADSRSRLQKIFKSSKNINKFNINDFWDGETLNTELLQSWLDANQAGLDAYEKATLESLIASGKEYEAAVAAQTAYVEQLWGDLASSIADNMINAFLETGDAMSNLEGIADDVAKNMAKSMIESWLMTEHFTKELQEDLLELLNAGNQEGANALVQGVLNSIKNEGSDLLNGIFEAFGINPKDAKDSSRTSTSQGFAQASQDSINKIDGILTNIENHTYGIFELMKGGSGFSSSLAGVDLSGIQAHTFNMQELMKVQQSNMQVMLGDIGAIRANTNRLEAVENHLLGVNRRLDNVVSGIDFMNRG
jgi:tape measure domain-containing protein